MEKPGAMMAGSVRERRSGGGPLRLTSASAAAAAAALRNKQVMLNFMVISLMAALVNARFQDFGRTLKPLPPSSLVNLGKIDVSFYINSRPQDIPAKSETRGSTLLSSLDGPCPCSSMKLLKDTSLRSPSELLSKILSGNDIFSNKEPTTSMLCCDSHENVREDVLVEFSPKQNQIIESSHNSFPILPFIFDGIQRPRLPKNPVKNSAVEILFYPKKQGILPFDFDKIVGPINVLKKNGSVKKDAIKIVGDKELKNEIKSIKFIPILPSAGNKEEAVQTSTQGIREETTTTFNNKSNTI